ncbi:MAG TPA: hypothetical protein VGM94_18865 [Galbitalea sp.]|jgi:hypothetical protein
MAFSFPAATPAVPANIPLRPKGFVGRVQIVVSALRCVRATDLAVELERKEEIELDGDGFGTATGFHSWVDEGGITTRVPAS